MHIHMANYQTMVWNKATDNSPKIPCHIGHGWTVHESGNLEQEWTQCFIVPQELVDIICETGDVNEAELESDTDVVDNIDYEEEEEDEKDNMVDKIYEDCDEG